MIFKIVGIGGGLGLDIFFFLFCEDFLFVFDWIVYKVKIILIIVLWYINIDNYFIYWNILNYNK